jgi:hypothetical protein
MGLCEPYDYADLSLRVARHLVKQFGQGRGKDINAPIHEAETVQHAVDYVLTHIKVDLACRTVRDLHEALTGEKKPKASRPLNFQRPGVRSCGRPGVGPARAFSPLLDPRSAQIPNCAQPAGFSKFWMESRPCRIPTPFWRRMSFCERLPLRPSLRRITANKPDQGV